MSAMLSITHLCIMYFVTRIVRATGKTYFCGSDCKPGLILCVTEGQSTNHRVIVETIFARCREGSLSREQCLALRAAELS